MPSNGLQNGTLASQLPSEASPAPSIYEASSVAAIRASLAALHSRDSRVTSRLQTLLTSQADLSRELGRLDLLRAHLGSQAIATRTISNTMLDTASSTAASLSSAVKDLDLEKKRV